MPGRFGGFTKWRAGAREIRSFFLEKCFHKLLLNFHLVGQQGMVKATTSSRRFLAWTTSRSSIAARTCRTRHPKAVRRHRVDGMSVLNMMRIALELAKTARPTRSCHQVLRALCVHRLGNETYGGTRLRTLEPDLTGFFYDVLRHADAATTSSRPLRVGLIPLYAVERIEDEWLEPFPNFR